MSQPPFLNEIAQSQVGAYAFARRLLKEDRGEKFVIDYLSKNWSFDPRDAAKIVAWAAKENEG